MAVDLELQEGEVVEKELKGDYWEGGIFSSQKTGKYWFTNRRIIFRGGFVAALDLPYSEILSADACNVGPLVKFMPTGIKVTMRNGKVYRLSVLKRKEMIQFILSKM